MMIVTERRGLRDGGASGNVAYTVNNYLFIKLEVGGMSYQLLPAVCFSRSHSQWLCV